MSRGGGGDFEASGPGADHRCAPTRAGTFASGRGQLRVWGVLKTRACAPARAGTPREGSKRTRGRDLLGGWKHRGWGIFKTPRPRGLLCFYNNQEHNEHQKKPQVRFCALKVERNIKGGMSCVRMVSVFGRWCPRVRVPFWSVAPSTSYAPSTFFWDFF
jgi:hypothetical protein